jgi:predicted metal-dependent RNase
VGYQVSGTIGSDVVAGQREVVLNDSYGRPFRVNLSLEVKQFEFSGHSSLDGLIQMLRYTGADKIIAMHGEPEAQQAFSQAASEIGKNVSILASHEKLIDFP